VEITNGTLNIKSSPSISIKVQVREKNPQQKKERAAKIFFNEIETKPLKFIKMRAG